jgi:bifunctional UDP-N-acetylglucosamine pyrophosphorylase/glucosamine-1-phosphate N-acetyltransferase
MLQGETRIGSGCQIGPNTRLNNCVVGSNTTIESTSAVNAHIGDNATVGPFAHLSPGSRVADGQTTGAFYDSETAPNASKSMGVSVEPD